MFGGFTKNKFGEFSSLKTKELLVKSGIEDSNANRFDTGNYAISNSQITEYGSNFNKHLIYQLKDNYPKTSQIFVCEFTSPDVDRMICINHLGYQLAMSTSDQSYFGPPAATVRAYFTISLPDGVKTVMTADDDVDENINFKQGENPEIKVGLTNEYELEDYKAKVQKSGFQFIVPAGEVIKLNLNFDFVQPPSDLEETRYKGCIFVNYSIINANEKDGDLDYHTN